MIIWTWQVFKFCREQRPLNPCDCRITYGSFEYWAARNVTKDNNFRVSRHTAERALRQLAHDGYLIREERGAYVVFRPSPKLCEKFREWISEAKQKTNI